MAHEFTTKTFHTTLNILFVLICSRHAILPLPFMMWEPFFILQFIEAELTTSPTPLGPRNLGSYGNDVMEPLAQFSPHPYAYVIQAYCLDEHVSVVYYVLWEFIIKWLVLYNRDAIPFMKVFWGDSVLCKCEVPRTFYEPAALCYFIWLYLRSYHFV